MPLIFPLFFCLLAGFFIWPFAAAAEGEYPANDPSVAVFVYHQVGGHDFGGGLISPALFGEHLNLIRNANYTALPLPDALAYFDDVTGAEKAGLPENALVLTFDGAFTSSYETAFKPLVSYGIPFTVFVVPDRVGQSADYMDWPLLQRLKTYPFVSFGILPLGYARITELTPAELRQNLNKAIYLFEKQMQIRPEYFSIPYGEYHLENLEVISEYNFKGLFGQQSGVVFKAIRDRVLPRYSLTEDYGDTDRFDLIARTKPLHIHDITPEDPYLLPGQPLSVGFNIDEAHLSDSGPVNCYGSGYGKLDLQQVSATRFEIRFDGPLPPGRFRVNCTQAYPVIKPGEQPRSRWYGMIFTMAATPAEPTTDVFSE